MGEKATRSAWSRFFEAQTQAGRQAECRSELEIWALTAGVGRALPLLGMKRSGEAIVEHGLRCDSAWRALDRRNSLIEAR